MNKAAVYKIPDHLSFEKAAMSEPLACAVQAVEELGKIHVGDTVLVSGPGPIGLLCLSLLVMKGSKVLVAGTDVDSKRLDIAKELGANLVINVEKENIAEIVARETGGKGVDVVVESAGAPASIRTAMDLIKYQGTYIQVGIVGKSFEFDYDKLLYKQLSFYGSYTHSRKTWDRTMRIWDQAKIVVDPIITHKVPLTDWEIGFDLADNKQSGKVLLYYEE